jgi:hypothetical protein
VRPIDGRRRRGGGREGASRIVERAAGTREVTDRRARCANDVHETTRSAARVAVLVLLRMTVVVGAPLPVPVPVPVPVLVLVLVLVALLVLVRLRRSP